LKVENGKLGVRGNKEDPEMSTTAPLKITRDAALGGEENSSPFRARESALLD